MTDLPNLFLWIQQQKTTQMESQLCHKLHKHFNASRTTIGNFTKNIEINRNNETADVAYLRNITNTFCRPITDSETNNSGGNDDSLECSFTNKQLSKWWYYSMGLRFTFGKFYLSTVTSFWVTTCILFIYLSSIHGSCTDVELTGLIPSTDQNTQLVQLKHCD